MASLSMYCRLNPYSPKPLTKHTPSRYHHHHSSSSLFPFSPSSLPKSQFIRFSTMAAQSSPSEKPLNSVIVEQQRVIVKNKSGENIVGILHETGSTKIVILCHGFQSSKDSRINKNLAEVLTKQGISAFRFDFSGNGESEGTFQYGNYIKEADDLHSVVMHFVGLKRVVGAIVGHSKGGDVVLVYASKYHDVPTVVNLSGRYNMERGIAERLGKDYMEIIEKDGFIDVKDKEGNVQYRVTKESLLERLSTKMDALCLLFGKDCRVLTVHGSADEIIPVEDAFEFDKVIANHKLHIVEGADHCYTKHPTKLAEVVVDYINESFQANTITLH
ncbi:hypothetical protein MKW92_018652 [Papaver armeniacum]|nr:hypothetical protein MKW92_018652 [Papaver armeniacum]